MSEDTELYVESGGYGDDLLVLLHGIGATAAVWTPFLENVAKWWPGRWAAFDLPGHGASGRLPRYDVTSMATAVGSAITRHAAGSDRIVVLGHSLGGCLALGLSTGEFTVQPDLVMGFGVKLAWSEQDLEGMAGMASRPAKIFEDEGAAWERYRKVSGLFALADTGSPVLARGVTPADGGWRLSMDPRANDVGLPPTGAFAAAARRPFHLAQGGGDPMVTLDETRSVDRSAVDLGGFGHNVMVEAPGVVWDWFAAHAPSGGGAA